MTGGYASEIYHQPNDHSFQTPTICRQLVEINNPDSFGRLSNVMLFLCCSSLVIPSFIFSVYFVVFLRFSFVESCNDITGLFRNIYHFWRAELLVLWLRFSWALVRLWGMLEVVWDVSKGSVINCYAVKWCLWNAELNLTFFLTSFNKWQMSGTIIGQTLPEFSACAKGKRRKCFCWFLCWPASLGAFS